MLGLSVKLSLVMDFFIPFYLISNGLKYWVYKTVQPDDTDIIYYFFFFTYVPFRVSFLSWMFMILRKEKAVLNRLLRRQYTAFETDIVRKVCSESLFPYYIMFTPNNNVWYALKVILKKDETVWYPTFLDIIINGHTYRKTVFFITSMDRIVFIQLKGYGSFADCDLVYEFPISAISNIDYEFNLQFKDFGTDGVYSDVIIELKDGTVLESDKIYSRTAEIIKDLMWQKGCKENLKEHEMSVPYTTRQLRKLEEYYNEGKIRTKYYEKFKNKVQMTTEQALKYLAKNRKEKTLLDIWLHR